MLDWAPTAIAAAATLLGVGLGAWLTTLRESHTAQRVRGWALTDQRRAERRDIYVRFLVASDRAMHEAWETGRKRTTIFSMEEGQQHYLDWISARDEMRNHLTELRLAAPSPIYVLAAQVSASAWRFGDKSLLAGTKEGMDYSSSEYQKTYDELAAKLIEEMQKDIYGTEINDVSIGPAIKSPKQ